MKKLPEMPLPGEECMILNHTYEIKNVESFTSELRGFEGIRVTLNDGSDLFWAVALWMGRQIVGRKSKLGAFILALGNDPDKWVGQKIQFKKWEPRDRVIEKVG